MSRLPLPRPRCQKFEALPRRCHVCKILAETGHELPEREKEAYARSRACRLALIDHAVAHKKPPLNAFKPHPEHKYALIPSAPSAAIPFCLGACSYS